jgi:hypothetical protein
MVGCVLRTIIEFVLLVGAWNAPTWLRAIPDKTASARRGIRGNGWKS